MDYVSRKQLGEIRIVRKKIYDLSVEHLSLKELYQNIYSDYLHLKEQNQDFSNQFCATKLAEKYNFTPNNILRIIQIMSDDVIGDYWKKNRKISKTETLNRDKAIFIEYLRWTGSQKEFNKYAAEKYNLTRASIVMILKLCLYANPERNNMV